MPEDRLATFDLMTLYPVAFARACAALLRWLKGNDIHVVHVHHRRLAMILGWLRLFHEYKLIYTGNLTYRYEFLFWLFSPRIATGVTHSMIKNLSLQRQAEVLGIGHAIEFRGFQKNVIAQIEEALFAVLPSRVEGQAIVTIEAATRGRASLVNDVDGSRDCVPPDRVLPNLIRFGDVAGLADALEAWFVQPVLAVSEGRVFFDYLKSSSSNANIGNKYRALYEQVAASRRRSAAGQPKDE